MSDATVRVGLVGFGTGGRVFHAPLIASADGCEFVGVVTTSPERRAELARAHPGIPAYDSLAALAAAGAEAVAISTPAVTRVPLAREALALGLAVVCDKPFALDAAAALGTVELAEQAGAVLTVFQNRRWDSDFLTVRRLIAVDELGSVRRFESGFDRWAPRGPRAAGGGGLLDLGSHLVDQALQLLGPVTTVYAEVHRRPDLDDLDDDFFLALSHRDGARSHLRASWAQGAPGPRFRVTGTTGSYVVDGVDGQEDALRAGRSPATDGDAWGVEPAERWGRVQRGAESSPAPTERGRWDTFYPAFAAAVRRRAPVPVDPRDAVACLRVLDAAKVSAAEGAVVAIGD